MIGSILLFCLGVSSQTITPDLLDKNKWRLLNRSSEVITKDGKKGIRLSEAPNDGLMILKDFEFSNGTIEFDVKGKNVPQQSFVGVAFHCQDTNRYDAVYFRPFNFMNADTARRRRAVQYVSMPDYPWEKLRNDFPGKYENRLIPATDPDRWFHVKVVVAGKKITVCVENNAQPSLEVEKLTGINKGGFALWVGNNSGAAFANLKITPSADLAANAKTIQYGNNPEAGKYFNAGNVKLYYEVYGSGEPVLMLHGGVYGYISEFEGLIEKLSANYQVICLATRGHGKSEIGRDAYTYQQRADDAYKLLQHLKIDKAMVIGFSDGANAGYKLAAAYPDAVKKLVAMGAGDGKKDLKSEKFNYNADDLMKSAGKYFEGLKKLMPEPQRWNESLQMLNQLYNNDIISTETFTKIKCPVLVMSGDRDNYSSVDKVVSCYKQIPNATLSIIPGCGHVIFFCNFPAVWESMKGFLKSEISTK